MPANIHPQRRHPNPNPLLKPYSNRNMPRQSQPDSISDPLPIPSVSGLEETGAIETVSATGSSLVVPTDAPPPANNALNSPNESGILGFGTVTVTTTTSGSSTVSSTASESSTAGPSTGGATNVSIPTVVGICVGVFVGLVCAVVAVIWYFRRKSQQRPNRGLNGGKFKRISDGGSFVGGKGDDDKDLDVGYGVGLGMATGSEKGSVARSKSKSRSWRKSHSKTGSSGVEKPPPYSSFVGPRGPASRDSAAGTGTSQTLTVAGPALLPPISPASPIQISISPFGSRI